MSGRDIAVVGMACLFPEAENLAAFWTNLVNGVDAVSSLPTDRWPGSRNAQMPEGHFARIATSRGGFIPTPYYFDPLRFKVMPSVVKRGDVDQFILLNLLGDALEDAAIGPGHPARQRTDVIIGRGGYASNKAMEIFLQADLIDRLERFLTSRFPELDSASVERLVQELHDSLPLGDVDSITTAIPNLAASRASNRLDLHGTSYVVDAACASSLIAVEQAVRRLRDGVCDVGLAGGISFNQVPSFWHLFTQLMALSPSGQIRPFDRRADGILLGEGAGAVVLCRLEDAVAAGQRIYAVIRGVGSASDGGATGVLAPAARGQIQALEAAYNDAGLDPETISMLEAHGTGTVLGDAAEVESIRAIYGRRRGPYAVRPMGSVKSMIGHTMIAAGIASLIKTVLALSSKVIPPSLHCEEPRSDLEDLPFYVNTLVRPWIHAPQAGPRRAGVNAFGFGGINAHVILEEFTPSQSASSRPTPQTAGVAVGGPDAASRPPLPSVHRPSELLVFAGASAADLAAGLEHTVTFLGAHRGDFTLEDLAHTLSHDIDQGGSHKLAVVATCREDLGPRLAALARRIAAGEDVMDEREGIYHGRDAARPCGRIAGLFPGLAFPGLAGNYPDHLMMLALHRPEVREVFDAVEQRDGHPDDSLPSSFILQPPPHVEAAERERLRRRFAILVSDFGKPGPPLAASDRLLLGMGMLASNWAGWRLLQPLGVPMDMLCGQSMGDISALCAAGMLEFEEMLPRVWRYLDFDPRRPEAGCMGYIALAEDRLAPYLKDFAGVSIALHPSPEAVIVGGPEEEVSDLVRRLRGEGVMAHKLPLLPVHTPRMEDMQREFQDLEGEPLPLRPPQLTLYSTVTESPMPSDPEELRAVVAGNITRPLRFWQTLRRMYADGARIFIQIGTGTLASNIRSLLPEKDVISVALDVDHRHPVTQLHHFCGRLLTAGVSLRLEALFYARQPSLLPLDRPAAASRPRGIPLTLYWPPLPVPAAAAVAGPAGQAPAAPMAPAPSPLPFVGRIEVHEPGRRLVQVRRFSLDEDLYLHDHHFITGQDFKPLKDRFPVVPMTVSLEMMAETGACLAPGRGLLSVQDVRARRWIALHGLDHLDVRVEVEVVDNNGGPAAGANDADAITVKARIFHGDDVAASAVLHYGNRYRVSLDMQFSPLDNAEPLPIPVQHLYRDLHLFHGPRFQVLSAIHSRGPRGVAGEIRVPDLSNFLRSVSDPALLLDPVALDGAAQTLGAIFFDRQGHLLPVGIDAVEFYRPRPAPGTLVPVRTEILEYDPEARRLRAMMEVQDGDGGVWFRVMGWQDILFRYSKPLLLARRLPTRHTLARQEPLAGLPAGAVATFLPREFLRDADVERLGQIYLHADEWRELHAAATPRRKRAWIMGRIAAKDAARLWVARRHGDADREMMHPVLITIVNDAAGHPEVRMPGVTDLPAISITHTDDAAAAAAWEKPIGIDMEPDDAGSRLDTTDFASADEIDRLTAAAGVAGDDRLWRTRLWCGKEAAAKTLGTGLMGRPRSFRVIGIEPDGSMVVEHGDPPRRLQVTTSRVEGALLAVASLLPEASPAPAVPETPHLRT